MARHIHAVHVEGFRCLKDVRFELTDLHAFIGPNDSGKSTLLEAVRHAVSIARAQGAPSKSWTVELGDELVVRASPGRNPSWGLFRAGVLVKDPQTYLATLGVPAHVHLVRLDPDQLRQPTGLIPSSKPEIWFSNERGLGLPAVYDALLNRQLSDFLALQQSVQNLFPTVDAIILDTPDNHTKALAVRLRDGTQVPAANMSEGLLYYLAFAAMQKIARASVLLIEEPENGLHPARIAEVIRVLREIAKDSQVVIATHSPLVVNALQPDEVSVVTRHLETGTKVTPIRATPRFDERVEIFALGELWIAYANGDDEAPLLEGTGPK